LIVVGDDIFSSFLLDNEGNNAIIRDWCCFVVVVVVVVECGFTWQHSVQNYIFCNPKESQLFKL
jgi:hypothetical protein